LAILRTAESPAEAENLYRHVIEVQPDHAPIHLDLGFLLVSLGRSDEGEALIDRAIVLDPELESPRAPEPGSAEPSPRPPRNLKPLARLRTRVELLLIDLRGT
jgi:tetratricopeptide (TPR) repeat protein